MALTLTRKLGEEVVFELADGGLIWVTVYDIQRKYVMVTIDAPRNVELESTEIEIRLGKSIEIPIPDFRRSISIGLKETRKNQIRLTFSAPEEVLITRAEVFNR